MCVAQPNNTNSTLLVIADTGASNTYLNQDASYINNQPIGAPINVGLPDGKLLNSTHQCQLDLPHLPLQENWPTFYLD